MVELNEENKQPQEETDAVARSIVEFSQDLTAYRDQILRAPGKSKQKSEEVQKLFANAFKELTEVESKLNTIKAELRDHIYCEKTNPDGSLLKPSIEKLDKTLKIDLESVREEF